MAKKINMYTNVSLRTAASKYIPPPPHLLPTGHTFKGFPKFLPFDRSFRLWTQNMTTNQSMDSMSSKKKHKVLYVGPRACMQHFANDIPKTA